MFKGFEIDTKIDVPIYQQLTDMIKAKALSGELASGTKMPTVRELSKTLGVAQGTVKRAYDELETQGIVNKAQGKGTFINLGESANTNMESRKDRAMLAIDKMFDELESMGFSGTEIDIFLELKSRERESRHEKIKIALVESNPEVLFSLVDQLRNPELDIYPYLISDIKAYPYKIGEGINLIITTEVNFDELKEILPQNERVMRIALSLATSAVHGILMIPPKSKVGILSDSKEFGDMIFREIDRYDLKIEVDPPVIFDECKKPNKWMEEHDYILVPDNYEKYVNESIKEAIGEARNKGKVILCTYRMDQGSNIQVEERIKAVISKR